MKKKFLIKTTAFTLCMSLAFSTLSVHASEISSSEPATEEAQVSTFTDPQSQDSLPPQSDTETIGEPQTPVPSTEPETAMPPETDATAPPETETQAPPQSESETDSPESQAGESESSESESIDLENEAAPIDEDDPTTQFVRRLYNVILLREPDPKGLEEWVNQLKSGVETGAEVTRGFVFSKEFIERNYSNEEYISLLYKAILGRDPDEAGLAAWVSELETGFSRLHICSGFVGSVEFTKLCESYGITRGSIQSSDLVDQNENLTRFVSRLYTLILQRKPDRTGLSQWVSQLYNHNNTAAVVISGFTNSVEFKERSFTDEEYITILYQTIFNRAPDSEGMNTWKGNLDAGMSRTFVLYHLVFSKEFTELCQQYNVTKGEIELTEARDMNKDLTVYLNTTYKNCLGRGGSADELNSWTQSLNNGKKPSEFLSTLLFSSESNSSQLSGQDFIRLMFLTVLHREPNANEIAAWSLDLSNAGNDRTAVFESLLGTDEYRNMISNLGFSEVRRYQNPAGYYQIQDSIAPLSGGGYELNMGYMGLKVYKVQQRLGISNSRAIVDITFVNTVKKFQKQKGLKVDGVVGLNTWKALGFSESEWYSIGTYISPLKVDKNSSRSDCIEAAINTAYTYLGNKYIIGASGAPGTGVDCSGLVMQALYSAGLDLSPINPVRHSKAGYEYESANMWASSQFKHVPYGERRRGDLIFYQNAYGTIIHVAIYLGNNQVIEAWPPVVTVWPIQNATRSNIAGVVRPFI